MKSFAPFKELSVQFIWKTRKIFYDEGVRVDSLASNS